MKCKYYFLISIIMMLLINMSFASCSSESDSDGGGLGGGEWYMSGFNYTMDQLNQSMYDLFNGDWSNCPANCFDSDGKLNITYQQPPTYSVSLDGYLIKTTYAPMKLTTDGFKFIQIVNSNTLILYFEGAIYKADYKYGTKVYELEGNKYTGPLAVFADDPRYLTYTREGDYLIISVEGKTEKITISGNTLTIDDIRFYKISTAKSMSTTNIVDNSSPNTNNNINLNNYSSCPDENHPHLIDLGLPSGTKWACSNIDANVPGQYGNQYAWGETTSKSDFNWSNYKYPNNNIGKDISGTQYDVAHEKWGDSWCMPNKDQFEELLKNTTSEWFVAPGDVIGRKFIGKNGNMIFLPILNSEAKGAFYWTSTNSKTQSSQSYKLYFYTDSRTVEINASNHCDGNSIRPIQGNGAGGGGGTSDESYAILLQKLLKSPLMMEVVDITKPIYSNLCSALTGKYTFEHESYGDPDYFAWISVKADENPSHSINYRDLDFYQMWLTESTDGSSSTTSFIYDFRIKESDLQDPVVMGRILEKDFNNANIPIKLDASERFATFHFSAYDFDFTYYDFVDTYYPNDISYNLDFEFGFNWVKEEQYWIFQIRGYYIRHQ